MRITPFVVLLTTVVGCDDPDAFGLEQRGPALTLKTSDIDDKTVHKGDLVIEKGDEVVFHFGGELHVTGDLKVNGTITSEPGGWVRLFVDGSVEVTGSGRILGGAGTAGAADSGDFAQGGDGEEGGWVTLQVGERITVRDGGRIEGGDGGAGGLAEHYGEGWASVNGGKGGLGGFVKLTAHEYLILGTVAAGDGGQGGAAHAHVFIEGPELKAHLAEHAEAGPHDLDGVTAWADGGAGGSGGPLVFWLLGDTHDALTVPGSMHAGHGGDSGIARAFTNGAEARARQDGAGNGGDVELWAVNQPRDNCDLGVFMKTPTVVAGNGGTSMNRDPASVQLHHVFGSWSEAHHRAQARSGKGGDGGQFELKYAKCEKLQDRDGVGDESGHVEAWNATEYDPQLGNLPKGRIGGASAVASVP